MDTIGASKVMRSTDEVSTALPDLNAVGLAELTAQSATLGQAVLRAFAGSQAGPALVPVPGRGPEFSSSI